MVESPGLWGFGVFFFFFLGVGGGGGGAYIAGFMGMACPKPEPWTGKPCVPGIDSSPQPQTLKTPNPKPQNLNPKTQTPNPKPQTPNPKP